LRYCVEQIVKEHEARNIAVPSTSFKQARKDVMKIKEVAGILGMSQTHIFRLIYSKKLKATKCKSKSRNIDFWQITRKDLQDYQDVKAKLTELKRSEKKEFSNLAHEIAERMGVTGVLILGTNKLENGNNTLSLYNLDFNQVGGLVLNLGHQLCDISNKEGK
jgi:hypothetical protein